MCDMMCMEGFSRNPAALDKILLLLETKVHTQLVEKGCGGKFIVSH